MQGNYVRLSSMMRSTSDCLLEPSDVVYLLIVHVLLSLAFQCVSGDEFHSLPEKLQENC